jgi:hypothetical protein
MTVRTVGFNATLNGNKSDSSVGMHTIPANGTLNRTKALKWLNGNNRGKNLYFKGRHERKTNVGNCFYETAVLRSKQRNC